MPETFHQRDFLMGICGVSFFICPGADAIVPASPGPLTFPMETLSIFLGDVLASIFVALGAIFLWYLLKYPGFRVGANWTFTGWDTQKMGRFPNESDLGQMVLMPNVSVTSFDMSVKKVIHAVWVRERSNPNDPGEILGMLDLRKEGMAAEIRTTGGDLLALRGPTITCDASRFTRVMNFPIFIQTSDGEFYKAESPGNEPKGVVRIRYKLHNYLYPVKEWILNKLR